MSNDAYAQVINEGHMQGYRTRWCIPDEHHESAEYLESVTPTLPLRLLHRLARALEGELDLEITGSTRADSKRWHLDAPEYAGSGSAQVST